MLTRPGTESSVDMKLTLLSLPAERSVGGPWAQPCSSGCGELEMCT